MAVDRTGGARAAYAGFAVFGGFWGAWGASIPAIRDQAGVSDGQLGTALLFVGAGALPAMLLSGSTLLGVLSDRVPDGMRASATAIVTGVAYLGFLAGPVYVGLWADTLGLSGAMFALAGLAAILAVLAPAVLHRITTRRSGWALPTNQVSPLVLGFGGSNRPPAGKSRGGPTTSGEEPRSVDPTVATNATPWPRSVGPP